MRAAQAALAGVVSLVLACGVQALAAAPEQATPGHYLFYLHGAWIEEHGLLDPNPDYGRYEYGEITRALSATGFTVISEPRLRPVEIDAYADEIVREVRALVDRGVRTDAITVAGHSKGAKIALVVASKLEMPRVSFVVMAACPKDKTASRSEYLAFVKNEAPSLHGRILSVYDRSDAFAASCSEALARADATNVETREIVLDTGKGHGLFYAPASVWIDEIVKWSGLRGP